MRYFPAWARIANWQVGRRRSSRADIRQIFYSSATRAQLDRHFIPLDNTANARPDWREYDPIRRCLLGNIESFRDDVFYGFFSPRFGEKTGLSSQMVDQFIGQNSAFDVIDFCREGFHQSLFLNTFVQGDQIHIGFLDIAQKVVGALGVDADLSSLVMDTTCSPYSNHFVAKPRFWRRWLEFSEKIFCVAEGEGEIARMLRADVTYSSRSRFSEAVVREDLPAKVFIIERLASLILTLEPAWLSTAYQPFKSFDAENKSVHQSQIAFARQCDSLKSLYRKAPSPEYKRAYNQLLEGQPWRRKWL